MRNSCAKKTILNLIEFVGKKFIFCGLGNFRFIIFGMRIIVSIVGAVNW